MTDGRRVVSPLPVCVCSRLLLPGVLSPGLQPLPRPRGLGACSDGEGGGRRGAWTQGHNGLEETRRLTVRYLDAKCGRCGSIYETDSFLRGRFGSLTQVWTLWLGDIYQKVTVC